ncbi:MAG: hypothetical protein COW19_09780 [Zetaproteobacteria bacterium CG12_big_fil_rev_8_21_14_0_65_55_1124]|nr:MAG: hypothetical protein AUJ58_08185 [Zetaproteobacteria bacterium CG1_02_55_237]PIS18395.1 MAG: hypothetical protein COT53_11120 [Zetaproteobacteria bacterium CG08_land_8_20_14_0_20_55_17]PIW42147.1 MAG: hypothetical protein COW19_09780 [Zetaproteobacteria bacterium CG12_big_fil_rev_8_21_14_0_65_55_1124]PIY53245.1 MAG: hypothetical protein COZ01_04730 [Zetaproteobacteria bacterium CG_4_10_14_0_8_um_filter_55_43]PIZ38617.1 MAG: hypothetical protein COY36_05765 [Zetaproteobacteria bacterium 
MIDTSKRLTLRSLAIVTYRENVAYMHRDWPFYRAEGFQTLTKLRVSGRHKQILAVLNVVDDEGIVDVEDIALSEEAFAQMGLSEGAMVSIGHAEPRSSMEAKNTGVHRCSPVKPCTSPTVFDARVLS